MKFQPKTDWKYDDIPTEADFNRIEQGIADALEGNDPIIQQDTPPDGVKEGRLWLDTSDDTYQGTVFESLKGEIDGHLGDEVKHVTQEEHDKIGGALQRTGGALTGDLEINKDGGRIKFNRPSNAIDGNAGISVYDNTVYQTGKDLFFNFPSKQWQVGTEPILHLGNASTLLASLGVGITASGTYGGDATNSRFINVGFTPKAVFLLNRSNGGTLIYIDVNGAVRIFDRISWFTPGNAVASNGFYVSYNGNTDGPNVPSHNYYWVAIA
ncbi:hypothetical protein [Cytobacillus sp.]|uniref:hypothetical protein n=1 Tax=Cytobacillus sp. TaxID=2675269 RepID=UPI0028BEF590|nr:hypothetical protein [Cytobacillus sp.]